MYNIDDYVYYDIPPKPWWFKNLEEAWAANRELGVMRRDAKSKKDLDKFKKEFPTTAKELLSDPELWFTYCREREIGITRPVGRPNLPSHLKKSSTKVKRSDLMKQLLKENGITVDVDGTLLGSNGRYVGWKFQPNGRVRFEDEDPISVHKFLSLM